ncbi:N-acetylglucosamine-6-phosphate deacetylase [Flindersiella endophytica]
MTVLGNGRVVTHDAILDPGWIEVDGSRIVAVGGGAPARIDFDLANRYVVPGFVDTHVHGGGGGAYTSADPGSIAKVAAFHLSHGTTSTIASLVSAPAEDLERQVTALVEAMRSGRADTVAGIHLEGPWLSPGKKGAHDPEVLRPPTATEVGRLLELAGGTIRMVTIAPELDGGPAAVEQVVAAGAVVAVGHTMATYDQAKRAMDAGATVATHLYNAMPSLHHREPGAVAALLEDPRCTVELIADGHHVHPAMLDLAVRAAGVDRVSLVTDAMQAAGLGDGEYELGGRAVKVRNGLVRLRDGDSIAGSTLTMDAAFRFVVREIGVSMIEAARMAATNPAGALGLVDVGALRTGLQADLVLLDSALDVSAVMRAGAWVPDEHREN